jgi:hypothetical protein
MKYETLLKKHDAKYSVDKIKKSGVEKEDEFVSKSIQKMTVLFFSTITYCWDDPSQRDSSIKSKCVLSHPRAE